LLTVDIVTENTVDEDLSEALLEKKANINVYKYFMQRLKYDKSEAFKLANVGVPS
jgi:hypothetical protein